MPLNDLSQCALEASFLILEKPAHISEGIRCLTEWHMMCVSLHSNFTKKYSCTNNFRNFVSCNDFLR